MSPQDISLIIALGTMRRREIIAELAAGHAAQCARTPTQQAIVPSIEAEVLLTGEWARLIVTDGERPSAEGEFLVQPAVILDAFCMASKLVRTSPNDDGNAQAVQAEEMGVPLLMVPNAVDDSRYLPVRHLIAGIVAHASIRSVLTRIAVALSMLRIRRDSRLPMRFSRTQPAKTKVELAAPASLLGESEAKATTCFKRT